MHFEGRLASGPEEIFDLFAEFIQQTYTDDVWMPSDPGPEHVPDDPTFGALQFTIAEVESVLQDLIVNKGSGPDGIPPFQRLLIVCVINCCWMRCLWIPSSQNACGRDLICQRESSE
jgi:hypothetical protein